MKMVKVRILDSDGVLLGLRSGFVLEFGVRDTKGEGIGIGGVAFLKGRSFVGEVGGLGHVRIVGVGGVFVEEIVDNARFGLESWLAGLGHGRRDEFRVEVWLRVGLSVELGGRGGVVLSEGRL
jgi:hypothetical protein